MGTSRSRERQAMGQNLGSMLLLLLWLLLLLSTLSPNCYGCCCWVQTPNELEMMMNGCDGSGAWFRAEVVAVPVATIHSEWLSGWPPLNGERTAPEREREQAMIYSGCCQAH